MAAPLILTSEIIADTGGSPQDISVAGPGQVPSAAMIWMVQATVNDLPRRSDWIYSLGMATSASNRHAVASTSEDNAPTSNAAQSSISDGVVLFTPPGTKSTVTAKADITFDTDKVTLTWITPPEGPFLIKATLLFGEVAVGYTTPLPVDQDDSLPVSVPFRPRAFFCWANEKMATPPDQRDDFRGSIGFAYDNGTFVQQIALVSRLISTGQETVNCDGRLTTSRVAGHPDFNGGIAVSVEIENITDISFDFTVRDGDTEGDAGVFWMALGGDVGDYWLGTIASPAFPGVQNYTTPGIAIGSAFFLGTAFTAVDQPFDDSQEAGLLGFGCADGQDEWTVSFSNEQDAPTTTHNTLGGTSAMNMMDGLGNSVMTFSDFAAIENGFSVDWGSVQFGQIVPVLGLISTSSEAILEAATGEGSASDMAADASAPLGIATGEGSASDLGAGLPLRASLGIGIATEIQSDRTSDLEVATGEGSARNFITSLFLEVALGLGSAADFVDERTQGKAVGIGTAVEFDGILLLGLAIGVAGTGIGFAGEAPADGSESSTSIAEARTDAAINQAASAARIR